MSDVHRRDAELFAALSPTLGHEATVLLLDRLPPAAEELATRSELAELRAAASDEFAALRSDAKAEFADLRNETRSEFASIAGRFDRLEEKLDLRFESLRHELNGNLHMELHRAISSQTRSLLIGVAGILVSCTGLAATLAHFG